MEWLTAIRGAVAYMEEHLTEDISLDDVARAVHLSPFFLQRGFSLLTGWGVGEYLRNRRLYEAALDLQKGSEKVIDIALRYGYETPESFTKAFARFHGATPTQVRAGAPIRAFLPMTIQISVQGGSKMEPKITPMFPFKLIGFQKVFTYEEAYSEIPKFWDETCERYANNVYAGNPPYLIAGKYTGGPVPEGMVLYEFPRGEWAVFDCVGPNPQTLQSVNTRIFQEWLPGNPDYELSGNATVEWYDCLHGEMTDADYHSAIWVPVKRKD